MHGLNSNNRMTVLRQFLVCCGFSLFDDWLYVGVRCWLPEIKDNFGPFTNRIFRRISVDCGRVGLVGHIAASDELRLSSTSHISREYILPSCEASVELRSRSAGPIRNLSYHLVYDN